MSGWFQSPALAGALFDLHSVYWLPSKLGVAPPTGHSVRCRSSSGGTFGLNSDLTWTALHPDGRSACRDAKPTKASRLSAGRAKCSWLRDFHPTVAFTECFPHQRVGTAGGHPWTTCFPCANGSFRFQIKLALLCRGLRFRRLAGRVPGKLAFTNYLVLGVCSKPAPVRMSMWLR